MYSIFAILLAIVIAVFSVQNATPVNIKFFVWQFQNISLVLVILFSTIIGAATVFLISLIKTFSLKRELSAIKKERDLLSAAPSNQD